MTELEHQLVDKTLESIHKLELKIVELSNAVKALREHNDDQHKAMTDKLDQNIKSDTERLNSHSKDIDNHAERLATLEEWKKQFAEAVRNRMITWQSVSTVGAVIIAYLLSKFL